MFFVFLHEKGQQWHLGRPAFLRHTMNGKDGGKGVRGMEQRIIASGDDELREFLLPQASPGRSICLEGSGALCAGAGVFYVACDWGNVIWRFDSRMLVPTGLFAGGPGIAQMLLSPDGERLYVLCSEADSLLMLSAAGAPLMINRAGVNPSAMALDKTGDVIAVAGGECGKVLMLCAHTLSVLRQLDVPGVVMGVAISEGTVYALSLNEALSSTLTTYPPVGHRNMLTLPGLPGAMFLWGGQPVAATHEHLYILSADGARILNSFHMAGRAGRLLGCEGRLFATDTLGEMLFACGQPSGRWRMIADRVRDAVLL